MTTALIEVTTKGGTRFYRPACQCRWVGQTSSTVTWADMALNEHLDAAHTKEATA